MLADQQKNEIRKGRGGMKGEDSDGRCIYFQLGVRPLLQRPRKESFLAFRALILFQAPPRELFGWRMGGGRQGQLKFHIPAPLSGSQFHH